MQNTKNVSTENVIELYQIKQTENKHMFQVYCKSCGHHERDSFFYELADETRYKKVRLLKQGEKKDIILSMGSQFQTNSVPRKIKTSADFGAWGYGGGGPHDLAVNILYHFTDQDLEFARYCTGDFVEDVIRHLPNQKSLLLSGAYVTEWIQKRRQKMKENNEVASESGFWIERIAPDGFVWELRGLVAEKEYVNGYTNDFRTEVLSG